MTTDVSRFRYGECYSMAYALAQHTGWEIECLMAQRGSNAHIVHAWVIDQEGRPFDALGFSSREEIFNDFLADHPAAPTATFERDKSPEEFMQRLKVAYGPYADFSCYEKHFQKMLLEARQVIEQVLQPQLVAH